MNKAILRLAIPNIISNITVPLLSMVDMSIVGHLDKEIFISAIAIAVIIFNFMYWSFSFLRMGTSGFTAQAYGAGNSTETGVILLRSLLIAFSSGVLIVVLQYPIFEIFFRVVNAEQELKIYAADYFYIYVWAAPAVLGMYAFAGWYVGMQDARTPMVIAIAVNVINISLSLLFVYVFNMQLRGVALGSALAQLSGFLLSFTIWFFKYKNIRLTLDYTRLKDWSSYLPFFRVNADIFIRTLLLIAVTTFFTSISARMGAIVLAANALLMQLFTLFSYIMDGFAYAAEALTGRFVGAKQYLQLNRMIRNIFLWGLCFVALFTLGYGLFTESILGILTDKSEVIAVCEEYRMWILIVPIAGFSAFLWDGIFIGATASRQMRNSMFVAAGCFFVIYYSLQSHLGNNALWLAFIVYLSMRGVMQAILYRTKIKQTLI